MPYTPTNWVNGTTPCNATNMNHLETQYTEATNSFEQDLFTPFVLSGLVCTRDGTTLNQLDVTAGVAFLLQSADNTLRRRATAASTPGQFTTSTINTTYYLFLNADGTFTWGTTSTGPANSLAICQATTDASGNILVVTDKRPLTTTLLASMAGSLLVPGAIKTGSLFGSTGATHLFVQTLQSGATSLAISFNTWNGSASVIPLAVGVQNNGSLSHITQTGAIGMLAGQASAGSFGVPVIVAQTLQTSVTVTTQVTILTFTPPANGLYRAQMNIYQGNAVSAALLAQVHFTDPHGGVVGIDFVWGSNAAPTSLNGSNALGVGPNVVNLMPITFYASTTGAITLLYRNPGASPADFVDALIERLA